jgi:hypothetical protein
MKSQNSPMFFSKKKIVTCFVLATVLLGAVSGVLLLKRPSPQEAATTQLYAKASYLAEDIEGAFSSATGNSQEEIHKSISSYWANIYDSRTNAAGDMEWDAVFEGRDIRGGGLSYQDLSLVACIRYSVAAGAKRVVTAPMPCGNSLEASGFEQQNPNAAEVLLDARRLDKARSNGLRPEVLGNPI